jgi:hypothetical protein
LIASTVTGFFVYMSVIFVPIKLADMKAKQAGGVSMMESAEGGGPEHAPLPDDDEDEDEGPSSALAQVFEKLIETASGPIEWLCEMTIPHEPEEGEESTMWFGEPHILQPAALVLRRRACLPPAAAAARPLCLRPSPSSLTEEASLSSDCRRVQDRMGGQVVHAWLCGLAVLRGGAFRHDSYHCEVLL